MGKIYPTSVKLLVNKNPGHIQHVSRTFHKHVQQSIFEKVDFRKIGLGKSSFGKIDFGENRVSCMVHQV